MSQTKANKPGIALCISIDVEEEGLFSGKYPARGCGVENVSLLQKLEPLYSDFNIPLTLFCTWSVLNDAAARKTLAYMQDKCGAEIGLHLHHWSMPPYTGLDERGNPLRSIELAPEILRERLACLAKAAQDFQGMPSRSFRMGRWDMHASWRHMLSEIGIETDSSICPLRHFKNGPDHFSALADPWVMGKNGLLEAPVTQIPLFPQLSKIWNKFCPKNSRVKDCFHFFGALSANPFWHTPAIMRMCARLHAARGGKVLSLFWHSSEMLPGASPNVPDQETANAKLTGIYNFCRWLHEKFIITPLTLQQLHAKKAEFNFPVLEAASEARDW